MLEHSSRNQQVYSLIHKLVQSLWTISSFRTIVQVFTFTLDVLLTHRSKIICIYLACVTCLSLTSYRPKSRSFKVYIYGERLNDVKEPRDHRLSAGCEETHGP